MGVFYDMVTIINLAPVTLVVMFDGQSTNILPGESSIPRIAINHAKNQNPVPGSADMDNPNISGAQYLVSIKGAPNERQEPYTAEEWDELQNKPSRFDTDTFFAERLGPKEKVITRGKGRKVQAKSNFDAGVRISAPETFAESQ